MPEFASIFSGFKPPGAEVKRDIQTVESVGIAEAVDATDASPV